MCEYFDSHAHFGGEADVAAVVERAKAAGVTRIMAVGGSREDDDAALKAARRFPDDVTFAIGLGRHLAGELGESGVSGAVAELDGRLGELGASSPPAALGEIGLDFHYERETAEAQVGLFRSQLELARGHGLPVIVHSREAEKETLGELRAHFESLAGAAGCPGVVHCFTGSAEFARELTEMGYCLGFSGIITFKNVSDLRDVLATVPDENLLIETDAPYLAPVPHRGRPNEPAYVPHVAVAAAEIRGVTKEHIAAVTMENARRVFDRGRVSGIGCRVSGGGAGKK